MKPSLKYKTCNHIDNDWGDLIGLDKGIMGKRILQYYWPLMHSIGLVRIVH